MQSQTPGELMIGPTTTSIAAGTDKQLDVTFGSDEQDLIATEHQISHYPSYIENNKEHGNDSLSAGGSSDGQLAPIGIRKPSKQQNLHQGRNEGAFLKNQRSSPVQEESVEEEPEFESLVDSIQDFEKAKQRIAEMEKRYNTITFKQKKQLNKKAMKEKYTNFNYNTTVQDWKKPLMMPKPQTSFDEGETQFNFKAPTQKYHSPKDGSKGKSRTSVFTSAHKIRTASETLPHPLRQDSFGKTTTDGFHSTFTKLADIKADQNIPTINILRSASGQLTNIRGGVTPPAGKFSPAAGLLGKTHQFSTLEQAKKFRQRSLLEAATKDNLKGNNSIPEMNETDTQDAGTMMSPKQGVLYKGVTATTKTLLPIPSRVQTSQASSNAWAEEQRLKKFLKEFEEVEFTFQNSNEDPLQKIKKQMNFLRDKGLKFIGPTVAPEVIEIYDRSLNNILYFNEKRLNYFRNELKFYQLEKEKHVVMIEERDALIAVYKERDMSEDEKRKMAWKQRQIRTDKHKKFDETIEELFTQDALAVKKFEQPYIISQPEEERDREDEERTMNFRRMNWLEKDMDLMMRLIQLDVSETVKQQAQMNVDGLLTVIGDHLKEGVGLGIQNQIANFHIRIEEILKENQKLLKAKAPEKVDRCYQTENWNMERYLDELESLKRQKWILDKENRENREKLEQNKERIKRLKDDLARFIKKVQTMENKEKMIDQIMQEKDKNMTDIKQDHHIAIGQWVKKDIEKTKELRALNERYEMLNIAKITREVDLMKREEEMNKKLEAQENKVKEAKQAVSYFQKLLNKKNSELENTRDMLEMQLQFQAILEDEDSFEGLDAGKNKGKKKKKVNINDDQSLNSKRGPQQSLTTGRNNGGDLTAKNTVSSISKTSPKGDGSISSRGGLTQDGVLKAQQSAISIQNESHPGPSDLLAIPEKRSPKTIHKKADDVTIPISSPNQRENHSLGDKPQFKTQPLEPIIEDNSPLHTKTPQFEQKRKSQQSDDKVKSLSVVKEDGLNDQVIMEEEEPIRTQNISEIGGGPDNKTPATEQEGTQSPNGLSEKNSSDSLPRAETFNPFQTGQMDDVVERQSPISRISRASLLKSMMEKALTQKLKMSLGNRINDDKLLITTEEFGVQCEMELKSNHAQNDIAKVLQRPSFRLMLPINKPAGVTISTQTNDYQELVAKPKALKLGEDPPKKTPPFQGQRIKGTVSALLKSAQPNQPSISAGGQLAPALKSSVVSGSSSSPPPKLPIKNITQASNDFMDSLQHQIDLLKNHESFKQPKPPSRAKSPPQPVLPSRTDGFQRRTIIEDEDNLIKGKSVVFSSSGMNSRVQSPEEHIDKRPPTKKGAKSEKTIDIASSNIKQQPGGKKSGIQTSPTPPQTQQQQFKQEGKPDSKDNTSKASRGETPKLESQQSTKSFGKLVISPPPPPTIKEVVEENKGSTTDLPPSLPDTGTQPKPTIYLQQSATIKKGIETALNSLAQVSKHTKYARNAAGILENMLSLKQRGESVGSTEEQQPQTQPENQTTQKKNAKSQRSKAAGRQSRSKSQDSQEEQKTQLNNGEPPQTLEINTQGDRDGRGRSKKDLIEFDERTSQELAIMEYYMNMKPQKPFNAMVVGHRASVQQIRFSPEHSRSRSNSPQRYSLPRNKNGKDDVDIEVIQQNDENGQRKKTTVLMKKDGRDTLNSPSAILLPPNQQAPK